MSGLPVYGLFAVVILAGIVICSETPYLLMRGFRPVVIIFGVNL
jgi:hypothetical protein